MIVKIRDLMTESVVAAQPHQSVDHVRKMLKKNKVHAVPVVASDQTVVGIVSTADLASDLKPGTPIKHVMTDRVFTIPAYNNVNKAARLMRSHRLHHVVVTHEKKLAGMISSFDLLRLVEEHRYVAKPGPSQDRGQNNGS